MSIRIRELQTGDRVEIEGRVSKIEKDGVHVHILDAGLPFVASLFFTFNGVTVARILCVECGAQMFKDRAVFKCSNCGVSSGKS